MKKYEGAFILLSNLEEEVRKAEIEKIQNIITERQGIIEKVNEWGLRRLAYEINKKEKVIMFLLNLPQVQMLSMK